MPNFNDNQPDPTFWSARKLLQSIAPLIPTDPEAIEFQAMSVLWSRLVEKVPTYKRRVPSGRYRKQNVSEIVAAEVEKAMMRLNTVGKRASAEAEPIEPTLPTLPDDFDHAANMARIEAETAKDREAAERRAREYREFDPTIWIKSPPSE